MSSKAKIADLHRHAFGEEYVAKFQVSVDDLIGVDITQTASQLVKVETHLRFSQHLPPFHYMQ